MTIKGNVTRVSVRYAYQLRVLLRKRAICFARCPACCWCPRVRECSSFAPARGWGRDRTRRAAEAPSVFHIRTQRTGCARGPEPFFLFPREKEAAILPRMTAVCNIKLWQTGVLSIHRRDFRNLRGSFIFGGMQFPSAKRLVQMAAFHSGICSISFKSDSCNVPRNSLHELLPAAESVEQMVAS